MGEAIFEGISFVLALFSQVREQRSNCRFSTQDLFNQAPNYERVIQAGKDARHFWFALREWRGDDPEGYIGSLGAWAERRMKALGAD